MDNNLFIEYVMNFGLTRQEAGIYQCLLSEGKTTGYEVAKQTGISRSNAYNSLASMTEKGAAYLVEEGGTKKYVPVSLEEFCKNYIRKLEDSKKWLLKHAPSVKDQAEGYITIEGRRHILDKIKNLLAKVESRAYISCTSNFLLLLVEELDNLERKLGLVAKFGELRGVLKEIEEKLCDNDIQSALSLCERAGLLIEA